MASRVVSLLNAVVDALQARSDDEDFTDFEPDFIKSYNYAFTLEGLTEQPRVYVRLATKTGEVASRIQYKQTLPITIHILAAMPTTNETNDEQAKIDTESYINFVDEIERVMREDCRLVADCTLLGIETDPIAGQSQAEELNVFESIATYTYQITERNTL